MKYYTGLIIFVSGLLMFQPCSRGLDECDFFNDGPKEVKAQLPAESKILFDKGTSWDPVWFEDGRAVAFLTNNGAGDDIGVVYIKDGSFKQITHDGGKKSSLNLVPGGKGYIYVAGMGNERKVVFIRAKAGKGPKVIGRGWNPAVNKNGKSLLCDTRSGPVLYKNIRSDRQGKTVPFPEMESVTDAYPRFAGRNKIVFCQDGDVYLADMSSKGLAPIAQKSMTYLTYYEKAVVSPGMKRIAVFSTNAAALSKPVSVWTMPYPPQEKDKLAEVCLGDLVQWIDDDTLLIIRGGVCYKVKAAASADPEMMVKGMDAAVSPDANSIAVEYIHNDTNDDGLVNWKDNKILLLKEGGCD